MIMRSILAAAISLIALASAAPAFADDYTFTVPLRIENMDHATGGLVACGIYNRSGPIPRALGPGGQTWFTITDGNYSGNVVVPVNLGSGYTRADATHWQCHVAYFWRMPDGSIFNRSLTAGTRASEYQRYTGQAVASTVEEVSGPIPH
jgi:hypothetical protein